MSATPEALSLKSPRELYFDWERAQSEGAWDALGVEDGALAEYGLGALTRRLDLIGVSLQN
jgi:hypothetical protein